MEIITNDTPMPDVRKRAEHGELVTIDSLDMREQSEITALEEMDDTIIDPNHRERNIKLGKEIIKEELDTVIQILRANLDVFALKVEDIEGINKEVTEQH